MHYTIQGIDDAEQNIFEGLVSLSEAPALPAEWADEHGEDELALSDFASREVMNGPIDIEVECWGRRLA